jgi:hypothetical protein
VRTGASIRQRSMSLRTGFSAALRVTDPGTRA